MMHLKDGSMWMTASTDEEIIKKKTQGKEIGRELKIKRYEDKGDYKPSNVRFHTEGFWISHPIHKTCRMDCWRKFSMFHFYHNSCWPSCLHYSLQRDD